MIVTHDVDVQVNVSAFGDACECDHFSCLSLSNETATEICSGE